MSRYFFLLLMSLLVLNPICKEEENLTKSSAKTKTEFTIAMPKELSSHNDIYAYESRIELNQQAKRKDIYESIQFEPEAKAKTLNAEEKEELRSYAYLSDWDLKPNTEYKIIVKAFSDAEGKLLYNPGTFKLKIGPALKTFNPITSNSIIETIESEMKQIIPFYVSEFSEIETEVANFELGDMIAKDQRKDNDFKKLYSALKYKKEIWRTNKYKGQYGTLGFDLSPYLKNKKGLVVVKMKGDVLEQENIYEDGNYKSKLKNYKKETFSVIQSTDLGITVREDYEKSYVWVNSITKATPLGNIQVNLYVHGQSIGYCNTNQIGFCEFPKKHLSASSNNSFSLHANQFYYALNPSNQDRAFLLNGSYNYSSSHQIPNYSSNSYYGDSDTSFSHYYYSQTDAHTRNIASKIFFDRRLYRPGEIMFIKAILSQTEKGVLSAFKGNVQIEITDSTGNSLLKTKKDSSSEGGVWMSYQIPKEGKLGHYSVKMQTGNHYNNETFQVEEFKPVSFSVSVNPISEKENEQEFEVSANYLFGAPLDEAEVTYTVRRDNSYYTSSKDKLDADGKFKIQIDTTPEQKNYEFLDRKISYLDWSNYELLATVTNKDGNSVSKRISFSNAKNVRNIKTSIKESYLKVNNNFELEIALTDYEGKLVNDKTLEVYVVQSSWSSIRKLGIMGYYTSNELEKKLFLEKEIKLSGNKVKFQFAPSDQGDYDILIKEKESQSFTYRTVYAYTGDRYISWNFRSDNSLELSADKISYDIGETAKIILKSPYMKSRVMVTVEREKIFFQKTFDMTGNTTPLEIPILKEYLPDVKVNVMIIRERLAPAKELEEEQKETFTKDDLGLPEIKSGGIRLNVKLDSKLAKLKVHSDRKQYLPGANVKLEIDTEPNAEVTLSVADRGVLDLIGYEYANPLHGLYASFRHGVFGFDLRPTLMKQYTFEPKGQNPGGDYGEGEGGFAFNGEDGSRKNFKYTAFFSPNLKADANGKLIVNFQLPDNLTTFKIMAVVAANGKYNVSNTEIQVKKPISVLGVVPRFIRSVDKLQVGGLIVNQTGIKAKYKISLESNDFDTTEKSKEVILEVDKSTEVLFPIAINPISFLAKQKNDRILFNGSIVVEPIEQSLLSAKGFQAKEIRDKLYFEIPFRETSQITSFAETSYTDSEKKLQAKFPAANEVFLNKGELRTSMGNTVLVGLNKAFQFYASNPYFCMEQRTSAYLLSISSGQLLKEFAFTPPNEDGYDFKNIEKLFTGEMKDFQNTDGSFRLWKPGDSYGYPYLTAYVVYVMQIAREQGRKIDTNVYAKAIHFLEEYPKNIKGKMDYLFEDLTLLHYVLAKEKKPVESIEKTLLENLDKLTLRGLVYLAKGMAIRKNLSTFQEDQFLKKVLDKINSKFEYKNNRFIITQEKYDNYFLSYYNNQSAYASLLSYLIKFDPNHEGIPSLVQDALVLKDPWTDSHTTGLLALTLRDYRNHFELSDRNFKVSFSFNGKKLSESNFSGVNPTLTQYTSLFKDLNLGNKKDVEVSFKKEGKQGRLYYSTSFRYSSLEYKSEKQSNGMELERIIRDKQGSIHNSDTFKRGEVYEITLKVKLNTPEANLLVLDNIPSGFEIVNTAFLTESGEDNGKQESNYFYDEFWYENRRTYDEYRDDKALFSDEYAKLGEHTYSFKVRPLIKGESIYPSAEAFPMYKASTYARTGAKLIKVE